MCSANISWPQNRIRKFPYLLHVIVWLVGHVCDCTHDDLFLLNLVCQFELVVANLYSLQYQQLGLMHRKYLSGVQIRKQST